MYKWSTRSFSLLIKIIWLLINQPVVFRPVVAECRIFVFSSWVWFSSVWHLFFCSIYVKNDLLSPVGFLELLSVHLMGFFWQSCSDSCTIFHLAGFRNVAKASCHTSLKCSLPKWFRVLGPFGMKYKICVNQTVSKMKCKELSTDRAKVCAGPFSSTGHVWFWSKPTTCVFT